MLTQKVRFAKSYLTAHPPYVHFIMVLGIIVFFVVQLLRFYCCSNVDCHSEGHDSLLRSNGTGSDGLFGRQTAYQNVAEVNSKPSHYPTMDELAEMLTTVVDYFKIDQFIGFGMGAGSNILARYALHHPEHVWALFLLNPNGSTHGYYEWFHNRWSDLPSLQRGIFTDTLLAQLEAHWFGY
ncbi:unnamed protein product, partial [Rodentolepis nana]|uniref:AB hydrolase-1 domain-containing protein n=1 Tax=Rodentolepis nana TaxID=102285 RepID=A0A0R3T9I3_RODNA